MLRRLAPLFVTLFCVSFALAQSPAASYPKWEFYGGYLATGEFTYNEFRFPGNANAEGDFGSKSAVEASVLRNFGRHFGLKVDYSAQFSQVKGQGPVQVPCGTTTCPVQETIVVSPRLFNFLVGPEWKLRNNTRFTPFGYALAGVAYAKADLSIHGQAVNLDTSTSDTGFASAVGLGLDTRVARHFSFRSQLDVNPKFVGRDDNGARTWLNDLRFSVGILVH